MNTSRVLTICVLLLCGSAFALGQNGSGNGSGSGSGAQTTDTSVPKVTTPYKILRQPSAEYTSAARRNGFEGRVRLKIVLLANGQVGTITLVPNENTVEAQKYGLVDTAIAAAKKIKFIPKRVNGVPVPIIITREYSFSSGL
jgi:TonB family protein